MGNCVINATDPTVCAPTATNDNKLQTLMEDKISYQIYDDASGFERWEEWMAANIDDATDREISNQDEYTGFALKLVCDFTNVEDVQYSACCLELDEVGGDCIMSANTDLSTISTYRMTSANFETWVSSPTTLKDNYDSWELALDNDNTVSFNRHGCTGENSIMTCYKFQSLADVVVSGDPRFD